MFTFERFHKGSTLLISGSWSYAWQCQCNRGSGTAIIRCSGSSSHSRELPGHGMHGRDTRQGWAPALVLGSTWGAVQHLKLGNFDWISIKSWWFLPMTRKVWLHKWAKWVWAWRQYHASHTKIAGKWCKWMFIPPLSGRYWPILKRLCPEMGNTVYPQIDCRLSNSSGLNSVLVTNPWDFHILEPVLYCIFIVFFVGGF